MKKLLLTLDYELFGDGSGDVFKHIVEPTNSILEVAERYGAKITVFFEVVEYWRLKQQWESGNHMGYDNNPVEAMEKQVVDMIRRGHDVQLHFHPQWVDAKWVDDHWEVDYKNWRLSDFNSSIMTLKQLISKGKHTLEGIIQPHFPAYECYALRAGGYNAQPSEAIVEALRECGMRVDTSIVPGAIEQGALSIYDYSTSPSDMGKWFVDEKLEEPCKENTDIIELPIVSFPIVRLFKFMSITRIKSIMLNHKSAQASFTAKTSSGGTRGGIIRKISFFFKKEFQTWDYCLFPCWMHRYFLHKISKQKSRDIFVLIGHPKSLVSIKNLEFMLKVVKDKMKFAILSDLT
ncbi:MAG: hypothetical protein J6X22_03005 [Muribaculaceae bacterium]|nr:hypothetical protein [Muribaculaceae bacterium]